MLADTAKLAIDLSLTGNARTGLAGVQKQLAAVDRQTGKIGQGFKTLGAGIGVAFRNAAVIGIAALGGLAALVTKSIREGQDAAKVQTIYATAIRNSAKSTGSFSEQLKAANANLAKAEGAHKKNAKAIQTAKDAVIALTVRQKFLGPVTAQYVAVLDKQQTALMNLAGVDDELIKTSQTRLIQMGLNGGAVSKLTPLILDLSKATGKDLLTSTIAVGKAANGNAASLQKFGVFVDKAKFKVDPFTATMEALNQKFGGTTKALSGSLEARLGAFRENMANIREELGIKLLPAITRIVDVAGKDLVPAFGKFIDRIMPALLEGINKFADMLENGGAERGIKGITDALGPMVDLLKIAAAPVKAIVSAFLSLPPQVQGVLIAGFAANKLSGGLIAKGVGEIAGGIFQRGGTPANPLFVMDVSGGLGGIAGTAAAGASLATALIAALPIAAGAAIVYATAQNKGSFDPRDLRRRQGTTVAQTAEMFGPPMGAGNGSLTGVIGAAVAKLFKAVADSPGAVASGAALLRKGVTERAKAAGFHPSEAAIQRTLDKNAAHQAAIQERIKANTGDTVSELVRVRLAILAAGVASGGRWSTPSGGGVPPGTPGTKGGGSGVLGPGHHLAGGGTAWAGQSYLVGENGPEILRMNSASGRVISNPRRMQAGGPDPGSATGLLGPLLDWLGGDGRQPLHPGIESPAQRNMRLRRLHDSRPTEDRGAFVIKAVATSRDISTASTVKSRFGPNVAQAGGI